MAAAYERADAAARAEYRDGPPVGAMIAVRADDTSEGVTRHVPQAPTVKVDGLSVLDAAYARADAEARAAAQAGPPAGALVKRA